ncbi:hypothetical protein, partial [Sphaerisporangium aureirubrum]
QDQTLQTMSEEQSKQDTPALHGSASSKENHPHSTRRTRASQGTGFMHIHALAFSTLLSSQETDAYSDRTGLEAQPHRGVHLSVTLPDPDSPDQIV